MLILCPGVYLPLKAAEDELWAAARKEAMRNWTEVEFGSMPQEQKDWHWLFCFADALLWLVGFSFSLDQHLCIDLAHTHTHTFPTRFDKAHPMACFTVDVPLTELIHPVPGGGATLPSYLLLSATSLMTEFHIVHSNFKGPQDHFVKWDAVSLFGSDRNSFVMHLNKEMVIKK